VAFLGPVWFSNGTTTLEYFIINKLFLCPLGLKRSILVSF
jgi:hypothetical protein